MGFNKLLVVLHLLARKHLVHALVVQAKHLSVAGSKLVGCTIVVPAELAHVAPWSELGARVVTRFPLLADIACWDFYNHSSCGSVPGHLSLQTSSARLSALDARRRFGYGWPMDT